jgi:RNA recognition motif-containing protein
MSRTLYVSNLPLSATEEMLAIKFGLFGTVLSVKITRDPATGRSQRCGFVEMTNAFEAQKAVNGLNLADYDGRLISVNKALASNESGVERPQTEDHGE